MTAGQVALHLGDSKAVVPTLPDCSVHSIVTDPPYELGFMGKKWDASGIAYDVALWRECLRVLKPGGHMLAFGGSRTYHRMASAIEDAGFEIRDQIMWLYGSGFPKSHNLEGDWDGWGTALKPAHEPIVVARKPLIRTVAENVLSHGTGALNIDGCRVPANGDSLNGGRISAKTDGWDRPWKHDEEAIAACKERGAASVVKAEELGRWPANVIHDGSEEVLAGFPQTESGKPCGVKAGNNNKVYGQFAGGIPVTGFGDSGSAARFFYCAKASRKDRDEGCENLDKKPLHWSSGDQNPGSFQSPGTEKAARNHHPTVKPTELMRYLCRLVTPPGGTVLDPFMGSGSTGKAALREGFGFIGIEREPEYFEIAKARVASGEAQPQMIFPMTKPAPKEKEPDLFDFTAA